MTTRLVSFLGLGKENLPERYEPIQYEWNGARSSRTPLVQRGVLELFAPVDEVIMLGTAKVKEEWEDSGRLAGALGRDVKLILVKDGQSVEELREIFSQVLDAFGVGISDRQTPDRLLVDITHGFRIQPILATSALSFALSEWGRNEQTPPEIQVLYGAFDARQDDVAPIWDLTEIVTVAQWNAAIDALLRFGRADDFSRLAEAESRHAVHAAREAGIKGAALAPESFFGSLGKAARLFADDLALGRTQNLLTESAAYFSKLLERDEMRLWLRRMPVLDGAVQKLREVLAPLSTPTLHSHAGVRAAVELAKHYERIQRYTELTATIRETLVTLVGVSGDDGVELPEPGSPGCKDARAVMENRLGKAALAARDGAVGEVTSHDSGRGAPASSLSEFGRLAGDIHEARNDVAHMGYNDGPSSAAKLRKIVGEYLDRLDELVERLASHRAS